MKKLLFLSIFLLFFLSFDISFAQEYHSAVNINEYITNTSYNATTSVFEMTFTNIPSGVSCSEAWFWNGTTWSINTNGSNFPPPKTTFTQGIHVDEGVGIYALFLKNGCPVATTTATYVAPIFWNGSSAVLVGLENTRIIDFNPQNGITTASTTVEFDVTAYVNEEDIGNIIGVQISLENFNQNTLNPFADITLLDYNIDEAGYFYFATSTVLEEGNYRIEACLIRSYFGGTFVNPFVNLITNVPDCQSHQFVVISSTFLGNLSQDAFTDINNFFASTTAMSQDDLVLTCNPLDGSFSIRTCLAFLFIPDSASLQQTFSSFSQGFLSRFPWGYATRIYTILSDSSSASTPVLSIEFPTGEGLPTAIAGQSITFDPFSAFATSSPLMTATDFDGNTFLDSFTPIWNSIVLFLFGVGLFHMLLDFKHHYKQPKYNKKI